jgi:outer membrane usher protein FimD/PapC
MQVTVTEADGSTARYAIEWSGVAQLGADGVTRETLKLGDHLILSGNPGQNASDRRVRLLSLQRPSDGFGWWMQPGKAMN